MVKNYAIFKKIPPLFFLLFSFATFSQTQIFSTPGASTFTVPSCVSSVTIQAWGGGASGGVSNDDARGGGGGGGYVTNTYNTVTAGQTIAIVVGAGGIITNSTSKPGVNGGASSYNYSSLVTAGGGSITKENDGGAGGAISGPFGAGSLKGGDGADRVGKGTQGGGGGGSGPSATNASGQTSGTPGGGNGGNTSFAGVSGTAPGGGGGGKGDGDTSLIQSGNGANGQVIITWTSNETTVWNGSVSTDWNIDANWSCGKVPTITTNVLIPTIPTGGRFPTIFVGDAEGLSNNIEVQTDASIIIEGVIDISTGTGTGNALNIAGNLTLNGIIDLNGESQLLQDTGSTLDAASTGSIELDQQGTGDSFNYNYWSSPVNSNLAAKTYSIGGVLKDGSDAAYKPIDFGAAHTWADGVATPAFIKLSTYWMYKLENSKGYAAWTRIRDNISIKVGEGYTMKGSNTAATEQNYTFVGKPNNGDISLPIAVDNVYLVGNPYPSALDAWKFIDDNSAHTGPLYFWEHSGGGTHNLAGYQGGYATYTKSGGVTAAINGPVPGVSTSINATKVPGRYIPVGQAFFVVGETAGDIIFNNNQRAFEKESDGFSTFMKNSNTKAKTENTLGADLRPKFSIGFDAPKISHRQLLLTIDEKASPAVDRGYEAEIYEVFEDDFYWMLDDKRYVIQATNNMGLNSEVPIGIQLSKTGMVTVKIDALENVDDDTSIYLKDKVTGESFNMREKPIQLNLVAGKYADRFVLVFKTQKLISEDVVAEVLIPAAAQPIIEGIHVFMNNAISELQIKNNSTEEIVSVALLNSLGQTVKTWNSNFNIRTISLPLSTATGAYIVQINTKNGTVVQKVIVE